MRKQVNLKCVTCSRQHRGLDSSLPRRINQSENEKLLSCGEITFNLCTKLKVVKPIPTWTGVVSHGNHKLGPFPESVQEELHQVPDVLGIHRRERVLVALDGGQREAGAVRLVHPEKVNGGTEHSGE